MRNIFKKTRKRLKKHVIFLSDQIGPRIVGSKSSALACKYIVSQLEEIVPKENIITENFDVHRYETLSSKMEIFIRGEDTKYNIPCFPGLYSISTYKQGMKGELKYVGWGRLNEFTTEDFNGKIVLARLGRERAAQIVQNATKVGASGVIWVSTRPGLGIFYGRSGFPLSSIPVVSIPFENGMDIIHKLEKNKCWTTINIQNRICLNKGTNITVKIGEKTTDIIGLIAHYDTKPKVPGAADNASGVAACIEIARELAKSGSASTLQIIFTDAEEYGLQGSLGYIERHKEKIHKFKCVIVVGCLDGSSPLLVTKKDGKFLTPKWLLKRLHNFFQSHEIKIKTKEYSHKLPLGISDHMPFLKAGIPATLLCCSWHNMRYYHTKHDTYDKIDYDFLTTTTLHLQNFLKNI